MSQKTDIVRNANNVARVANSQLVSADDELHPLMSLKTNRPIERFPETPRGVGKMSSTFRLPASPTSLVVPYPFPSSPPFCQSSLPLLSSSQSKDGSIVKTLQHNEDKALTKWTVTLVDSTLLALEADRSGKEEEKRERLRVQLGLKPNPA